MTTATVEPTATEATEVEDVVDTSAFDTAVADITVADAAKKESATMVNAHEVYQNLSPRSKRAAKRALKDAAEKLMLEAETPEDLQEARKLTQIYAFAARSKATPKSSGTSTRKTPEQKLIETYQAVYIAYQLLVKRSQAANIDLTSVSPEGIELSPAEAYVDWIEGGREGDEPEVDKLLARAARVSLGYGPGGQGRKPKKEEDAPHSADDSDDNE